MLSWEETISYGPVSSRPPLSTSPMPPVSGDACVFIGEVYSFSQQQTGPAQ